MSGPLFISEETTLHAANDNHKSERIFIEDVAAILGMPERSVQTMASRGKIPSAAKFGRRWTFNECAVRSLLNEEELKCQSAKPRPEHIGGMASFGGGSGSRVSQLSNSPLTQTIQKLQRDVSQQSKLN
jgi:Helix-turn-helix domain